MIAQHTSEQATGRAAFGRDDNYPWRGVILEQHSDGLWTIASIYEMATYADAEFEALAICTEPYASGVIAMHYYVGEVAQ